MPPHRTFIRLCFTLGLFCHVLSHPLHRRLNSAGSRRLLGGLLGGEDSDQDKPIPAAVQTTTEPRKVSYLTRIPFDGLGGFFTTTEISNKGTSIQVLSRTISVHSESSGAMPAQTTTPTIIPISTSDGDLPLATMLPPTDAAAPSVPPAEAAQWKVIGVATLCIALVAGAMLAVIFFDSWWRFLCALVGKKRTEPGMEDMVPDWGRRGWELKLASEDGHRYPTLASLESMTKDKQEALITLSPNPHHLVPMSPPALYLPELDPHPLAPLFRRPSASNILIRQDSSRRS